MSADDESRPIHIRILDTALDEARAEIDRASDALAAYQKTHAVIIQGHEAARERLRTAEKNRVLIDDGIRELGYDPKPRDPKETPNARD